MGWAYPEFGPKRLKISRLDHPIGGSRALLGEGGTWPPSLALLMKREGIRPLPAARLRRDLAAAAIERGHGASGRWSMTEKHFFIGRAGATVVAACSRRNAVQRPLSAGSRVAFTRRLVTLPGCWPRLRRSSSHAATPLARPSAFARATRCSIRVHAGRDRAEPPQACKVSRSPPPTCQPRLWREFA